MTGTSGKIGRFLETALLKMLELREFFRRILPECLVRVDRRKRLSHNARRHKLCRGKIFLH
ncbi:hypothetical protein SBA4_3070007 [Candidatus Sulfopaludibacter sp. SbA4]|nr:hypothetical protein SBA4_3070007 [Candidatus Sulfopaludibacter sp. SbA4]